MSPLLPRKGSLLGEEQRPDSRERRKSSLTACRHGKIFGDICLVVPRVGNLRCRPVRSSLSIFFSAPKKVNCDCLARCFKCASPMSAAFEVTDWQSMVDISKELQFLHSNHSCRAFYSNDQKWLRTVKIHLMDRRITLLEYRHVNLRPVLLCSGNPRHQFPVSRCRFLYPGYWAWKIASLKISHIQGFLVSQVSLHSS